MGVPNLQEYLAEERHRFVGFVRGLVSGRTDLDAEDIVQDVLTRLLGRADAGFSLDHMAAYAYRALRNRVTDQHRTSRPLYIDDDDTLLVDEDADALADLLALEQPPNRLPALDHPIRRRPLVGFVGAANRSCAFAVGGVLRRSLDYRQRPRAGQIPAG